MLVSGHSDRTNDCAHPQYVDIGLTTRIAATMEKVDFGSGYGYEVGSKDLPAVVVLQEWWGECCILKPASATSFTSVGMLCL